MTNPDKHVLRTVDRDLVVEAVLEENTFRLCVHPTSGEDHFMRLTFTKGFARELRQFLEKHDGGDTNFGALG